MSRGRLEIFSPDGPVQSYFLDKDTIAIGRSVGNDLILDRHGISRYHVTLTAQDQQALIEDLDSVNGTYVDGIRLDPNKPRSLRGGEEIQIGDVRLIFYPPADLDTTMQTRIEIMEADSFRAELEGPNIAITPGSHAPAILKIRNTNQQKLRLFVSIDGIPSEWVRLDRNEFELEADQETQIGINFKPLRRPDSTPGDYPFTIQVRTEDSSPLELQSRLQIQQYNSYGAVMGTPLVTEDQPFQLYIQNQGNGPLQLRFWGISREKPLNFAIRPPQIALAAGERQVVTGYVSPAQRQFIGTTRTYRYDIISHSLDAAGFQAPVSGQVQVSPLFPRQLLLFIVPAVLMIGAVFALLLISLLGDTDDRDDDQPATIPTIAQFELNATTIDLDNPMLVTWRTEDSANAYIEVKHGEQVVETVDLPGIQGDGYAISLLTAGRYEVILVAENSEAQSTQSTFVTVTPQVSMSFRTIPQGTLLYRNLTTQTIELEWEVFWTTEPTTIPAPTIYLNSPDLDISSQVVQTTPLRLEPPALKTLDTVNINLVVIGPDDIQTTTAAAIMVGYPECTTLAPQADVYQGPSEQYPLRGAMPPQVTVQIESRSSSGNWLYVVIPQEHLEIGLFGWIHVENLSCTGFDPTELSVTPDEELPPLPTAAPDE